jgi:hypothetical protein
VFELQADLSLPSDGHSAEKVLEKVRLLLYL